jgi:hypothetical protein
MNAALYRLNVFFLAGMIFCFSACVKETFDAPENNNSDPPGLAANISISDLKALYADTILNYNAAVEITENYILSGIVVVDDRSGNFYKSLILQDATAGIAIRIDRSDFYTDYPIGRRVFVRCKGLFIGQYNRLIQLGGYIDASTSPPSVATIPAPLIPNHLIKGQWGLTVTPMKVFIPDLNDNYQNMLVRLDSVQFQPSDTQQTYANAALQQAINRTLQDCQGNSIILRTSGYASFASALTPSGNGTLIAIYQVFGTTKQLLIRNLSDVMFTQPRCGSGGSGPQLVTIAFVRALFPGNTTVPANQKIKGIVISDRIHLNTDSRNLLVQDATAGIVVRFTSTHSFDLNDEVEVDISNQQLSTFNGWLQVNNVPNSNATKTGTGSITPQTLTIAQIVNGDWNLLESTLVRIQNCTISGPQPLSGSKTISDGSGSTLTLFTRSQATFASSNYPTGTVTITGFLSIYNATKQISIRNLADFQ